MTDGERKTITALFADLKGSTALIEGLDPEEARTVIDPALQLMMDAVHQYDGFVAQALEFVEQRGERFYEAELYRLKGEFLLMQEGFSLQAEGDRGKTAKAETCFLKAVEIA